MARILNAVEHALKLSYVVLDVMVMQLWSGRSLFDDCLIYLEVIIELRVEFGMSVITSVLRMV